MLVSKYSALDQHIDDEVLEQYALGGIGDEAELASIEQHLLVCGACQDRLNEEDEFARVLRVALGMLIWTRAHQTEDGPVELSVHRMNACKCIGKVRGETIDSGKRSVSATVAQRWCEEAFMRLFPELRCDDSCSHDEGQFTC